MIEVLRAAAGQLMKIDFDDKNLQVTQIVKRKRILIIFVIDIFNILKFKNN